MQNLYFFCIQNCTYIADNWIEQLFQEYWKCSRASSLNTKAQGSFQALQNAVCSSHERVTSWVAECDLGFRQRRSGNIKLILLCRKLFQLPLWVGARHPCIVTLPWKWQWSYSGMEIHMPHSLLCLGFLRKVENSFTSCHHGNVPWEVHCARNAAG